TGGAGAGRRAGWAGGYRDGGDGRQRRPEEPAAVVGVPVAGQPAHGGRHPGVEVVVVIAVEQGRVAAGADRDHGRAAAVVVTHLVGLVPAVAGGGGVGCTALHGAERVHELVALGVVPAGGVDPGVHRGGAVVDVVQPRAGVGVQAADPAEDVGVGPHQVLPVGRPSRDRKSTRLN